MKPAVIIWLMLETANSNVKEILLDKKDSFIDEQYYRETYSNTSCLFRHENHTFVFADANNFTFPEDSIFFIETSCRGGLEFRQACSVESAARVHPNRSINVLFAGRDSSETNSSRDFLKTLLTYNNVNFYKIHILDYAKGTPLEKLAEGSLKDSRYLLHHASDFLRFLTLYKFGGVYLDLDVFVVKSLDLLPVKKNWIGRDSDYGLAVGLVALSRSGIGKEISDAVLESLNTNFQTDEWAANGIGVTTKALEEVCGTSWREISPDTCEGFKIYEPKYFYPISSDYFENFLEPINGSINLTDVFTFHTWNYLIYGEEITEDSLHAALTRKYCPKVDKANFKYTGYNKSSSHNHPWKLRTVRLQRSKVDKIYDSIEINARQKQLTNNFLLRNRMKSRKSSHLYYYARYKPLAKKMPPKRSTHSLRTIKLKALWV